MILTALRDVRWRIANIAPAVVVAAIVAALAIWTGGKITGLKLEPGEVTRAQGAQSWIASSDSVGPFSAQASITAEQFSQVRGLADVLRADPVLAVRAPVNINGSQIDALVLGVSPGGLGGISTVIAGSNSVTSGELIVSKSSGAVIGNQVGIGGEQLNVVGVGDEISVFGGQTVVAGNIDDVRRLVAGGDAKLASMIVIRGEAPNLPSGLTRFDQASAERDLLGPVADRVSSLRRQRVVLWLVGAIVIGAAGWWLARKRHGDFVVSKSYDVPVRDLFVSHAAQSAAMAGAAVVGGAAGGVLLGCLSSAPFQIPPNLGLLALGSIVLATVSAAIAGLPEILRARPRLPFAAAEIARSQAAVV